MWERTVLQHALWIVCLLCPLGSITSDTHFLDFTLAHLSPTWRLLSVLLTPTKRNSQVR